MLLNLTNHPSSDWSFSQLESAIERWDTVVDIPFPDAPADFDEDQIIQLAETIVKKAVVLHPDAVLCQGEMTLAFSLVHMFHAYGIPAYAATSCRQSKEEVKEDGETQKQSIFRFVKFRKYPVIETG
ncbi:MAG: hypothetical protein K2L07_13270 [Lachnospiraceae bacterium]|nr:hypothetical protein [Lachnospiraceae bacterium]